MVPAGVVVMIDWIASALTLTGLYLAGKKKILCWPIWMVGDVLWIYVGAQHRMIPLIVLNTVFLGMNAKGYWEWKAKK